MMRPGPAIVSTLMLAASAAMAAPAPGQGAAPPPAQGASAPVVSATPALAPAGPARAGLRTRWSGSAKTDPGTEANCYFVFGEMRCDRMDSHRPSPGGVHR